MSLNNTILIYRCHLTAPHVSRMIYLILVMQRSLSYKLRMIHCFKLRRSHVLLSLWSADLLPVVIMIHRLDAGDIDQVIDQPFRFLRLIYSRRIDKVSYSIRDLS